MYCYVMLCPQELHTAEKTKLITQLGDAKNLIEQLEQDKVGHGSSHLVVLGNKTLFLFKQTFIKEFSVGVLDTERAIILPSSQTIVFD